MADDNFKRTLAVTIPQMFARSGYSNLGRVRIYSAGAGGVLLGTRTTTYGYSAEGVYGGSRGVSATEAQWSVPDFAYAPSTRPTPVGRLSSGHTLYAVPTAPELISTPSILRAGDTGVDLPGVAGRYYVSCAMTADGSHVMLFTRATSGSSNASAEMWHLMQWNGAAFVMLREGPLEIPLAQYVFGPGSSAADHFGCSMLERDLVTLWRTYPVGSTLTMSRIGLDGVMRDVHVFTNVSVDGRNEFWFSSIYANNGEAWVVAGDGLFRFQSRDPVPPPEPFEMPLFDVGLRQIDNGVFDLEWFEVVQGDDSRYVQTLVYAALFSDAEAPAAREPDRYQRRGWWRDPAAGCGLWHIRRQPLGSAARREAVELVREALERYGLAGVHVAERGSAGVSRVVLEVTGLYRDKPYLVSVPL